MRPGYQVLDTLAVKYPTLLYVLSLAGSALEGFGVVDGGAEVALHRDGPPLPEIGEGLVDAHPRGAYEGSEIALGGAWGIGVLSGVAPQPCCSLARSPTPSRA